MLLWQRKVRYRVSDDENLLSGGMNVILMFEANILAVSEIYFKTKFLLCFWIRTPHQFQQKSVLACAHRMSLSTVELLFNLIAHLPTLLR
jgi:hypothetical protein